MKITNRNLFCLSLMCALALVGLGQTKPQNAKPKKPSLAQQITAKRAEVKQLSVSISCGQFDTDCLRRELERSWKVVTAQTELEALLEKRGDAQAAELVALRRDMTVMKTKLKDFKPDEYKGLVDFKSSFYKVFEGGPESLSTRISSLETTLNQLAPQHKRMLWAVLILSVLALAWIGWLLLFRLLPSLKRRIHERQTGTRQVFG